MKISELMEKLDPYYAPQKSPESQITIAPGLEVEISYIMPHNPKVIALGLGSTLKISYKDGVITNIIIKTSDHSSNNIKTNISSLGVSQFAAATLDLLKNTDYIFDKITTKDNSSIHFALGNNSSIEIHELHGNIEITFSEECAYIVGDNQAG